jgi:aminoglycoside 2'-N-acetyltransferase I
LSQREPDRPRLRRLLTQELRPSEIAAIRTLVERAFGSDEKGRFTDADWDHSVGGVHFVLDVAGEIVAHASVVERELHIGGRPLRTGYVEAVATQPERQGAGFGSLVMADVTSWIKDRFELGGLGTGRQGFYQRLGWLIWIGPSSVRMGNREQPTPEDDGYLMVLPTPSSPRLDLTLPISCDWRPGDVW